MIAALGVLAAPASAASPLRLTAMGDFRQPVHVTGAPREPRAAFVLERGGRVWRMGPGGGRRLVLDARPLVRLLAPENQFRDQGGAFALALPPGYRPGGPAGMVAPSLALRQGRGMCAIVGGHVVRTPTLPELRGRYLYGGVCSGGLGSAGGAVGDRSERTAVPYLVSFG